VYEVEDFGAHLPAEVRERETRLRDLLEAKKAS